MKAGKIVSGEFSTEKAVKAGKAYLVVTASDASDNTRKKFENMCSFYQVPMEVYGNKDSLGACLGKQYRSSIAVTDENFSRAILKQLTSSLE